MPNGLIVDFVVQVLAGITLLGISGLFTWLAYRVVNYRRAFDSAARVYVEHIENLLFLWVPGTTADFP